MNILTNFGVGGTPSGASTATFSQASQQQTILVATNPSFPLNVVLSNQGIRMTRGAASVGIQIADLVSALLTVTPSLAPPPFISVQPPNRTIAYSLSTTFPITASSYLSGLTYQWQSDTGTSGNTWTNITSINASSYNATGYTTATLTLTTVTGSNRYQYRCIVTDTNGNTATTINALLTVIPDITAQPANSSVAHPTGTTFSVTATGTATLTYQWQCDNGSAGSTWTSITAAGTPGYSGYTTVTLTITTTATSMSGYKYRVIVTDGNSNSATSNGSATLTVS